MSLPTKRSVRRRIKPVIRRVVAGGVLLTLPACQIPGLRAPDPAPPLPPAFPQALPGAQGGVSSARLGVDAFFNDPVLTTLIDRALMNNRELRIQSEEVEIARNEILSRRGDILPSATVRAAAGPEKVSRYSREGALEEELQLLPGRGFPNPLWRFLGAIDFLIPIDIWRALRNARDAAEQRYLAAIERRNFTATRLVAEVAESYYRLMALDQRIDNLDRTIALQEQSLAFARAKLAAGRGTDLAVQRFQAEVRKNQSEKLIVQQEIVEVGNRIGFIGNRSPAEIDRRSDQFLTLDNFPLSVGVPADLLRNRPDIRQAERELAAAGLDVEVARARFYPTVTITASIGYAAFNPRYLFNTPEALAYDLAGNLAAPLINQAAIQADYMTANAQQLQAVYTYQRVVLSAFIEVINRVTKVQNYSRSIALKKQQLLSLEAAVASATLLFQNARAEYIEVLFAQRDLLDARMELINTKLEQLSAIANAYQALGGGVSRYLELLTTCPPAAPAAAPAPPVEALPPPQPVPVPPKGDPAGPKAPNVRPPAAVVPPGRDVFEELPVTRIDQPR